MTGINRIILIVLDGVGIGALPDADRYGDAGAHTLGHMFGDNPDLSLPNLCRLGLGGILPACHARAPYSGCYGKMTEKSSGKDTTTGHWEMMGMMLDAPFPTFTDGFPETLIRRFEKAIGRRTLGNYTRSGTVILAELGEAHLRTGWPIVYTSADSVFQIAAHTDRVSIKRLYAFCETARGLLSGPYAVGRVIARPFYGEPGNFKRNNGARKDFSLAPPGETLLDVLKKAGGNVVGIGKIGSIFAHRGTAREIPAKNNDDGMDGVLSAMKDPKHPKTLIFANLVDFDQVYGHRRDSRGFADALTAFDLQLPDITGNMQGDDLLMITADHGCDPAFSAHTDHTREYVPLLVYGPGIRRNVDLGIRTTFADIGRTISDLFELAPLDAGKSFRFLINREPGMKKE